MLPYSLPALGLLETCEATTGQGRVDWLTRSPSVFCLAASHPPALVLLLPGPQVWVGWPRKPHGA